MVLRRNSFKEKLLKRKKKSLAANSIDTELLSYYLLKNTK